MGPERMLLFDVDIFNLFTPDIGENRRQEKHEMAAEFHHFFVLGVQRSASIGHELENVFLYELRKKEREQGCNEQPAMSWIYGRMVH